MRSRFTSGGICLLVIGVGVAGCERSDETVNFVLPKGFEGVIYVKQQPDGGEIPKSGTSYKIVVPESGVVVFKNTEVFTRWHTETARYENGKSISIDLSTEGPMDQLCLYDHSRDSEGVNRFIVGPRRVIKHFIDKPSELIGHPPGRVEWPRQPTTSRAVG
jgi:hypothetical protein